VAWTKNATYQDAIAVSTIPCGEKLLLEVGIGGLALPDQLGLREKKRGGMLMETWVWTLILAGLLAWYLRHVVSVTDSCTLFACHRQLICVQPRLHDIFPKKKM